MRRFKKNNNLAKVFYSVFGSLPLLVTLYLYPLIPENIPVHYWFDGSIDKWGNKNELFLVPIIILLFVCAQPRLFKLHFNYKSEDNITKWSNYYFLLILNMLVYSTLYISMNFETCLSNFNFYNIFACTICFIFAFMGNYIPTSKRSSSVSIRTKYTLESPIIWNKFHKFCGFFWFSGSIVFFPMFLFSSGYYLLILFIIMILIFIVSPFIYAHHLHEKYLKGDLDEKVQQKKVQHSH